MAETRVTIGNRARISFELDVAGTPTDPASLVLFVRGALETLGPYTFGVGSVIVKDSVGRYHADVLPTRTGLYTWRYVGRDGSAVELAATEGRFYVVSFVEAR